MSKDIECKEYIDTKIQELAMATNAFAKGLLGFMGMSGHVAKTASAIKIELDTDQGLKHLINQIADTAIDNGLERGDTVVIAEKPFPVAERRLFPFDIIRKNDPKCANKGSRKELLRQIREVVSFSVDEKDLLLADQYTSDPKLGEMATCGASDHNKICYEIAELIYQKASILVDVVISDTDTGLDIGETIINSITIAASPVGATGGLTIYECMRVSVAAEFARGSEARTPIVLCKPAERCIERNGMGSYRGYQGKISTDKEPFMGYRCES